jgi:hypothetical protein
VDSPQILLNTTDSAYHQIQEELRSQLSALETVTFREEMEAAPAGALAFPGLEQVAAFIISHPTSMIGFATALVNLLNKILSRHEPAPRGNAPTAPRAVIVIGDKRLQFPTSEAQKERFLKAVEDMKPKKR